MIASFLNMTEPEEIEVLQASSWTRIRPSGFTSLIGPLWSNQEGEHRRCGFVVRAKHDNTALRAHGGMIMAFCDEALGITASDSRPDAQLFTISFECQFIGGAKMGDFVEVECEIVQKTSSLIFMRGTCVTGQRIVATCAGVWKVLGSRRQSPQAVASGGLNAG